MNGLVRGLARFLLGATIGAAAGAAVGILLAPASGEELKRQVLDRLHRVQEAGAQAERERVAALRRSFQAHITPRDETM